MENIFHPPKKRVQNNPLFEYGVDFLEIFLYNILKQI